MIKKISILTLIFTIISCTVFCFQTNAAVIQIVDVEHLENGDYIETVIITSEDSSADASIMASTKSGSKTKNYKNSSGAIMWSVTVKGTFSYTGSSSSCTSVSHSTTSPGSAWSIKSLSSSKSGNTATAKATATYSVGSITQDIPMSVSLKCSANGTLS